jgi:hypothetical protein
MGTNILPPSYFCPEDGGSIFLQNVHTHLPDYVVSKPRNSQYESSPSSDKCDAVTVLN